MTIILFIIIEIFDLQRPIFISDKATYQGFLLAFEKIILRGVFTQANGQKDR